jgi:lysophospholipase L1-like esterase
MSMILDPVSDSGPFSPLAVLKPKNCPCCGSRSLAYTAVRAAMLLILIWSEGCDSDSILIPDPAVRYFAFGDSSTAGDSGGAYVDFLPDLLGLPSEQFANQGKGGETASEGLDRLHQLLSLSIYPNAHTLLYWEGGIDILHFIREVDPLLLHSPLDSDYPYLGQLADALDRIHASIEAAITEGQGAGLTVYVATYFSSPETFAPCDPLFLNLITPSQARNANGYISLLNERIRQAVANTGARLIDVASANDKLRSNSSNFINCNHLSSSGNEIVAQLFAEALRQGQGG